MGYFVLPLSLAQAFIIILGELLRNRKSAQIDFISGINIIYFICFCIIPVYLITADLNNLGDWSWIMKNPFDRTAYLLAGIISLLGYICILMGYHTNSIVSQKGVYRNYCKDKGSYKTSNSCSRLLLLGTILFFISLVCLIIYVRSIGGLWVSLKYASAFRGENPPIVTKWSFFKNIIPLMKFASFFYYGAIKKAESSALKIYAKLMFILSFVIALYILFHKAGRRNLAFYLFAFLLANMIQKNRISKKAIVAFVFIAAFITVFGDSLFYMFLKDEILYNSISSFNPGVQDILKSILLEFSFPFVTLANSITELNTFINMRLFSDIPLGFAYMLPQRLLSIELPETISDYNTLRFSATGTIPVDLISFGYYSMGIAGVMLVCYFFGYILFCLKKIFENSNDYIMLIFKAEWMISMSFIVMYGDPDMIIKSNFSLFAGTFLLLFSDWKKRKHREEGINFENSCQSAIYITSSGWWGKRKSSSKLVEQHQ